MEQTGSGLTEFWMTGLLASERQEDVGKEHKIIK
tara:strand:- start:360 stop:461 length:102 start_codon:yes stop_codon:yes gene_type:complete